MQSSAAVYEGYHTGSYHVHISIRYSSSDRHLVGREGWRVDSKRGAVLLLLLLLLLCACVMVVKKICMISHLLITYIEHPPPQLLCVSGAQPSKQMDIVYHFRAEREPPPILPTPASFLGVPQTPPHLHELGRTLSHDLPHQGSHLGAGEVMLDQRQGAFFLLKTEKKSIKKKKGHNDKANNGDRQKGEREKRQISMRKKKSQRSYSSSQNKEHQN